VVPIAASSSDRSLPKKIFHILIFKNMNTNVLTYMRVVVAVVLMSTVSVLTANAQEVSNPLLGIKAAQAEDALNASRYYEDEYLVNIELSNGETTQQMTLPTESRRVGGFYAGLIGGAQMWRGDVRPMGGAMLGWEGKRFSATMSALISTDTFNDYSDRAGEQYFAPQFEATAGWNFAHLRAGGKINQRVLTLGVFGGFKLNRNSDKVAYETAEAYNENVFHVKGSTFMSGAFIRYTRHFWGTGFSWFLEGKAGVGLQYYREGSEQRAIAGLSAGVTYNFSKWRQKKATQEQVFGSQASYEAFKANNAKLNAARATK
jgi:hypothetical protein